MEHSHSYTTQLGIPVKFAGAVHGYSDYRQCTGCESRVPTSVVKPDGSLMSLEEYNASKGDR